MGLASKFQFPPVHLDMLVLMMFVCNRNLLPGVLAPSKLGERIGLHCKGSRQLTRCGPKPGIGAAVGAETPL